MSVKQAIKSAVLPKPGNRTLPAGIGRGVRMHLDFGYETRLFLGLYEIELNRHLRRLLQPGVSAFDVGANAGYDSLVITKHTGAQVAAFECNPAYLERMEKAFDLNPHLGPLITPVQAMVGTDLGIDDYAYGEGFVPDFIKLDVEGGEFDVLRSAPRVLSERKPSLVIEVHSAGLERQCGELLVDAGYAVTIVNQRKVLPDRRPTDELNRWLVATAQRPSGNGNRPLH